MDIGINIYLSVCVDFLQTEKPNRPSRKFSTQTSRNARLCLWKTYTDITKLFIDKLVVLLILRKDSLDLNESNLHYY